MEDTFLFVCDACDTYYRVSRFGREWNVQHREGDQAWKIELQQYRWPKCPSCWIPLTVASADSK